MPHVLTDHSATHKGLKLIAWLCVVALLRVGDPLHDIEGMAISVGLGDRDEDGL